MNPSIADFGLGEGKIKLGDALPGLQTAATQALKIWGEEPGVNCERRERRYS